MDVIVVEKTDNKLHLCRGPSTRAWAMLGALLIIVLGAAFTGYDNILWKLTYVTVAIVIGLSYMDEYEECIFDKSADQVTFIQETILQRYITKLWSDAAKVVAKMSEVSEIVVEEDSLGHTNTPAFHVVVKFTNYSIGVTQAAVIGEPSSHEKLAELIRQFLGIESNEPIIAQQPTRQDPSINIERPTSLVDERGDGDVILPGDESSSSSEDGFEKVNKKDLIDTPTDDMLLATPSSEATPSDDGEQIPVIDATRD